MTQGRYRSLEDPETLRLFVQNLREGIYITNAAGEILDANPACLEIFGVPSLEELRTLARPGPLRRSRAARRGDRPCSPARGRCGSWRS